MSVAKITAPLPAPVSAAPRSEPTHRFGRALDDRLPAQGLSPSPTATSDFTPASAAPAPTGETAAASSEDDAFSFDDFLDIINPLHHLPVVGTLYREFTGDEIGSAAKVIGGGIFGGVIGAAASMVDVAIKEMSGDDIGGHVMTALFGGDDVIPDNAPDNTNEKTQVAGYEAARQTAAQLAATQAAAAGLPAKPTTAPDNQATRIPQSSPASAPTRNPASPIVAPPPVNHGPPVPNLSPSAFDALMESFATGKSSGTDDDDRKAEAVPMAGLLYAAPPTPGRLVNHAL